jgi:hypothetical protein
MTIEQIDEKITKMEEEYPHLAEGTSATYTRITGYPTGQWKHLISVKKRNI